jgi:hypothetical protein
MRVTQATVLIQATDQAMATREQSQLRSAIGRITPVALVITWAVPIMCGDLDIGYGLAVVESGFTAITW